ncbi:2-oxoglutarate and iron-dependent oxygenase domain-containing protein [Phenylobacterium sp.]|uniref:2-oxoglutarate and iron-dependent oxygenase domain-containing protein n=1 Tax=Phenylobacterium sp. TaxID=1871053 RepID=UPI00273784FA|nr:2-oxoglutarate and iron-dependent oxygenase domain-containing protein [Phenylobacterium sp.]MDP3870718.1 2-oxoglutarate and iron-dependent oxygenase domain-containing protein [Phenylobacterium sp.]
MDPNVSVISLAAPPAQVREQLARACAGWGFFHLVGHGLDPGLLGAVISDCRA